MLSSSEVGCCVGWCWTNLCTHESISLSKEETLIHKKLTRENNYEYLVFEHVKKSCFPGVVETEKKNLGLLLPESERRQDAIEPIYEKHSSQIRPDPILTRSNPQNLERRRIPIRCHKRLWTEKEEKERER